MALSYLAIRQEQNKLEALSLGPDAKSFDPNDFKLLSKMAKKSAASSPSCESLLDDGALCEHLKDGDGVKLPCVKNCEVLEALRRKNKQIRCLKTEKRALTKDLKRSRRVGCELESDLARLQRQRRKEITRERRANRDLNDREKVVASREQENDRLLQSATHIHAVLYNEVRAQQSNAVKDVVRGLVDSVEQSANAQRQQENLEQLRTQAHELQTGHRTLSVELRTLKEQFGVLLQCLAEGVSRLKTLLDACQQELQLERTIRSELETQVTLQQEELTSSVTMLESLTFSNRTLSERLGSSAQQLVEVEAERDAWQNQVDQLQREHEQFQSEQVELQTTLRAALSDLEAKHRQAQVENLNIHQQLRIAQLALKAAQREQRSLRDQNQTLENASARQHASLLSQVTVALPKVENQRVDRLPTLRSLKR